MDVCENFVLAKSMPKSTLKIRLYQITVVLVCVFLL